MSTQYEGGGGGGVSARVIAVALSSGARRLAESAQVHREEAPAGVPRLWSRPTLHSPRLSGRVHVTPRLAIQATARHLMPWPSAGLVARIPEQVRTGLIRAVACSPAPPRPQHARKHRAAVQQLPAAGGALARWGTRRVRLVRGEGRGVSD